MMGEKNGTISEAYGLVALGYIFGVPQSDVTLIIHWLKLCNKDSLNHWYMRLLQLTPSVPRLYMYDLFYVFRKHHYCIV